MKKTIRTAFMRRNLDDWERVDEFVTLCTRAQVERLIPRSRASLEIQLQRDPEILEKYRFWQDRAHESRVRANDLHLRYQR